MFKNTLVLLSILVFGIGNAMAGYYQSNPVTIAPPNSFSNGGGRGDLASARFSDSDTELIGCSVRYEADGISYGYCQAADADGNTYFCLTLDLELMEPMHAISDLSWINFRGREFDPAIDDPWLTGENVCIHLQVSTQSFYIRDVKDSKAK